MPLQFFEIAGIQKGQNQQDQGTQAQEESDSEFDCCDIAGKYPQDKADAIAEQSDSPQPPKTFEPIDNRSVFFSKLIGIDIPEFSQFAKGYSHDHHLSIWKLQVLQSKLCKKSIASFASNVKRALQTATNSS
ncbi:MAG: hypothetical protein LBH87_03160 [Coriobacteriales bacterium]|jgi:hypothetical protein|nr:hypothetical protein [Coriobacteriales bacterium]